MNDHYHKAKALLQEALGEVILGSLLESSGKVPDERTQWRDISTAPKDHREILVCKATNANGDPICKANFGIFTQRVAWWPGEDGGQGAWVVYCSLPTEPLLFFEPTHWMPIPPPPEA